MGIFPGPVRMATRDTPNVTQRVVQELPTWETQESLALRNAADLPVKYWVL